MVVVFTVGVGAGFVAVGGTAVGGTAVGGTAVGGTAVATAAGAFVAGAGVGVGAGWQADSKTLAMTRILSTNISFFIDISSFLGFGLILYRVILLSTWIF
jgi:hypothetical protein